MSERIDVIIVGGGHNGLVAGTYLAKQGKRVVIAERSASAGGMVTSGALIPEAPQHIINPSAAELIHIRGNSVIADLDLVRHGYRTLETDPSYAYLAPDGESIAVFRDHRRTAEDIARFSKADAAAYLEFMQVILALMDIAQPMLRNDPSRPRAKDLLRTIGATIRHRKLRHQFTEFTSSTPDQIACERFEHPYTQALLLGIVAGAGPVDVDGHGIAYVLFGLLHRIGVAKPIGGMQMLTDALLASYQEAGGSLLLNAPVAEIMVQDGKTRGIRLDDGRTLAADVVIATCDPRTASRLATPGSIERRLMERLRHAPANRSNCGPSLLNLAMSSKISLRRHQTLRRDGADLNLACGLIGTAATVRDSFTASRRGLIPALPCFSVSPMTNWDPSQAPPGQGTAYIYLPATPVETVNGAEHRRMIEPVLREAAHYYDGIENEIGRWFESCPGRAVRLNVTNGCVTHVDFGSYRSGAKRPAVALGGATPLLPGLFLGGAGTHPGGGISGMPGKIAAERVLRYLKA